MPPCLPHTPSSIGFCVYLLYVRMCTCESDLKLLNFKFHNLPNNYGLQPL